MSKPFDRDAKDLQVTDALQDLRGRKPSMYLQPGGGIKLRGWQAIAQWLDISERTAQKYHTVWGMPVIRIVGRNVWTTTGAIENWVQQVSQVQRRILLEVERDVPELDRRLSSFDKLRLGRKPD